MLIVMAAAGLFVFNQAVVGGEPVRVPDIQNMYLRDAEAVLIERGLVMGTPSLVASDEVPPNVILSQRPKAGDVIRAGRKVYPSVSRGVKEVDAPDLVNMTIEEASAAVQQFRLEVEQASMPHSAMRGTVIAQDPPAGSRTNQGRISLLVSSGASSGLMMPPITGLSTQEVADVLAKNGLAGRPIQVNRPDADFDVVLDQRPPAGTTVTKGQVVEYDIRPSSQAEDAWYRVTLAVPIPGGSGSRLVRAEAIMKDGSREELFMRDVPSGAEMSFPFHFLEEATAVIYIDGIKYRSYYCDGDSQPVITRHNEWNQDAQSFSPA